MTDFLSSVKHLPDSHVVTLTLGELRGKTMPSHVTEKPDDTMAKVFKPRMRLAEPVSTSKAPKKTVRRTAKKAAKKARRK